MAGPAFSARAQGRKNIARIGLLATASPESRVPGVLLATFLEALRERGYEEGKSIVIETRWAGGRVERFSALAKELVQLKVDVIVALNSLAARAEQQATATIPIVVAVMGDPVGDGLVASLARPGGNITGLSFLAPELLPKLLALLKEALPGRSQFAGIWHPRAYGERTMTEMLRDTETAARTLGVGLRLVAVYRPDELDRAFSAIAEERADALLVFPSPMLFIQLRRVADFATKHRLPSMTNAREFAELGGFMAYGASIVDLFRRAATYVDKILKGAKPSDLPVEQPTKFELVINLKSAKALGLTVPEALLARADEVID
jgi:putative ABC transport system substrate-binding protein